MDVTSPSRKRQTGADEEAKSTDDGAESTGTRPKRRCTQKTAYTESNPNVGAQESRSAVQTTRKLSSAKPGTDINSMKVKYKWMDHDQETTKVRCKVCMAANLKKWFIVADENMTNLESLLKLHEASEEHQTSTRGVPATKSKKSSNTGTTTTVPTRIDKDTVRDVYCIPMECADALPTPGAQLRSLLSKHGLKGTVNFVLDLTPARLREDISKAFTNTFKLREQELLQFDYLATNSEENTLTRPEKMLHFDAQTILSFVGSREVYILLKQKVPSLNVSWKQLVYQETKLQNLSDAEYKEVMLNVMHRLSSGKHKKDSSSEQKVLVESLVSDYKLNMYHQLVYIGKSIDQLVLFTEKRRLEAFQTYHVGHSDLQTTFRKIFSKYYWNGIEDWVTAQVKACPECATKYGEYALATATIAMDKIEEEIKNVKSPAKVVVPLAPRPMQQPAVVQRIVPIPKPAAPTSPPSVPAISNRKDVSLPLATIVKKEPPITEQNDLLPPIEDNIDDVEGDRDETLYEEDLEAAIKRNSRSRSNGSHCDKTMWAAYLLQQRGMFCDFFIMLLPSVCNNLKKPKIYGVHRIIFAAISSRIRQITKTTIKIGGKVTCEGLENVIEYGYTGRLTAIREMKMGTLTQVSNTAMALDIDIDQYLRKERPDFTKTSAKILVTSNPSDKAGTSRDAKTLS